MSKVCDICQKGYQKGNQVPRGIGHRVTKRTIINKQVNLRAKRFDLNGGKVKLMVCSSCLKRMKFDARAEKAVAATTV